MNLKDDPFTDPLDALWADAMAAERRFPQQGRVRNATLKQITPTRELWTLPENWLEGRGIALIHEESHTLIGNFREYLHKRVPHTRKLVRQDTPISIQATEHVSGPSWLHIAKDIPPPFVSTEVRECLMDLTLEHLGIFAEAVELRVYFSYGGIARVELAVHTTFHSPDSRTILTLSAGTNVYLTMGLEAKIQLRKELAE